MRSKKLSYLRDTGKRRDKTQDKYIFKSNKHKA